MPKKKTVRLTLYRYAGKFLFFRIKNRCKECDISYVILQRLMNEQLRGKPVSLRIVPWLDNFWKVIWRGGWHAPILTVNEKVFSQGKVPDIPKLLSKIGKILNDTSLIQLGEAKIEKVSSPVEDSEITVYFSPACPHCRQLLSYLDTNGIEYLGKDVTKTESAREDVERLTGRLSIPVVVVKGEIINGFDRNRLKNLLGISADAEVVVIPEQNKILLSEIFNWYSGDFGKRRDVLEFVLSYLKSYDLAQYLNDHLDIIEVEYLFYDWNLNH